MNPRGGITTGFIVTYLVGATAPADCTLGTPVDVGNVETYTVNPLAITTEYSFRVCSYDGAATNSTGTSSSAYTYGTGWNQEAYIKVRHSL